MFCLGQFGDVERGVAQRDQLAPVWQLDWIENLLIPRHKLTIPRSLVPSPSYRTKTTSRTAKYNPAETTNIRPTAMAARRTS